MYEATLLLGYLAKKKTFLNNVKAIMLRLVEQYYQAFAILMMQNRDIGVQ